MIDCLELYNRKKRDIEDISSSQEEKDLEYLLSQKNMKDSKRKLKNLVLDDKQKRHSQKPLILDDEDDDSFIDIE